jgi:hypothetical protein
MDAGYTPACSEVPYSSQMVTHLTLQLLCVALISLARRSRSHLHTVCSRDSAILFSSDYLNYSYMNTCTYIIED